MQSTTLDVVGIRNGTDKGSIGHDYLVHYERNLGGLRAEAFTLLEIGVADGASIRMWCDFFPRARVVGVDIDAGCTRFANDRAVIEIGSQADRAFLAELGARYEPLVIIDDGSHLPDHNMISYRTLFPFVRPGGFYVIEDLYLHDPATSSYRADEIEIPADYFSALAAKLTAEAVGRGEPGRDGYLDAIDRIEFFRRGLLIQKKPVHNLQAVADAAFPLVEQAGSGFLWHSFSSFLLFNGLKLDQAEQASRKASALAPSNPHYRIRLADILERQSRVSEALEVAKGALSLEPGDTALAETVDRLAARVSAS